MNRREVEKLLEAVRAGRLAVTAAVERLRRLPYEQVGSARLDTHRELRTGVPEVVFAPGKTDAHLVAIARRLFVRHGAVLVTRLAPSRAARLRRALPGARWNAAAGLLSARRGPATAPGSGAIAVVSAGTADVPVAEEAAGTLEHLGWSVDRLYDVGVAGLHRLLEAAPRIDAAQAAIVVAGMEGALPTVVAGLTARPVVAVPTSVGYGASFGGVAALLTMLNSCAGGVAVVNIDNGFGAACFVHRVCADTGSEPAPTRRARAGRARQGRGR